MLGSGFTGDVGSQGSPGMRGQALVSCGDRGLLGISQRVFCGAPAAPGLQCGDLSVYLGAEAVAGAWHHWP